MTPRNPFSIRRPKLGAPPGPPRVTPRAARAPAPARAAALLGALAAGALFALALSPAADALPPAGEAPRLATPAPGDTTAPWPASSEEAERQSPLIAAITNPQTKFFTDTGLNYNSVHEYAVCAEYDTTGIAQGVPTWMDTGVTYGGLAGAGVVYPYISGAHAASINWNHDHEPDRFRRWVVFRWLAYTSPPNTYQYNLPQQRARVCGAPLLVLLTTGEPRQVSAQPTSSSGIRVRFWQSDLDAPIQSLTVLAQSPDGQNATVNVSPGGGTPQVVDQNPGRRHEAVLSGLTEWTNYTVTVRASWGGGNPPSEASTTARTAMRAPLDVAWIRESGGTAESTPWTYRVAWSGIDQHAATWRCRTQGPDPGGCDGTFREVNSSTSEVQIEGLRPTREHTVDVCSGTPAQQSAMEGDGVSQDVFCRSQPVTTPRPRPARPDIGSASGAYLPGMEEALSSGGSLPPGGMWMAWHAVRWENPVQDPSQPEAHLWPAESWEIYRLPSASGYDMNEVGSGWELLASYSEANAPADGSGPGWRHAEEEIPFEESRTYTVCARNETGVSCALDPVTLSVSESEIPSLDELPPEAVALLFSPGGVTTRVSDDPMVRVRWTGPTQLGGFQGLGPTEYRVQIRSTVNDDAREAIVPATAEAHEEAVLQPFHAYEARVCSLHPSADQACSPWHDFQTTSGILPGVRHQVASDREYVLSWMAPREYARSVIGNDLTLQSSSDGRRWEEVSRITIRSEQVELGRVPRGFQYRVCFLIDGALVCSDPSGGRS